MLLSEALDAIQKLLRAYPNGGASAEKGYAGALAAALCQYPRSVAARCADPLKGVARETRFLPTVADLIGWCERETAPLHRDCAREDRIAEQLRAREDVSETTPEMLAITQAWLDRTDPDAQAMLAGDAELEARLAALTAQLEDANRSAFVRECERDGIDPGRGVSPALLKVLGVAPCR